MADIFKRWAVVRGKKAILCTGTDEHGMKVYDYTQLLELSTETNVLFNQIQRAASAAKKDVRAFCDQNSEGFKVRRVV